MKKPGAKFVSRIAYRENQNPGTKSQNKTILRISYIVKKVTENRELKTKNLYLKLSTIH